MDFKYIKYEKKGHVAYVTMNRPEVMNALNIYCHVELDQIWNDFAADKNLWVAILTGAGERSFSAGNDLKFTAEHRGENLPGLPRSGFAGLTSRFDLAKPIIAAVNGYALGGGCETMLSCDIVIASENARIGVPEVLRGLIAGAGGVHRLPRQIPMKVAIGMIVTGKPLSAQEALRYGLINEVVAAPKDVVPAAERWAAEIMEASPTAVQAAKQAAMDGLGMPVEAAISKFYPAVAKLFSSKDMVEGPLAFAQKRKPVWTLD